MGSISRRELHQRGAPRQISGSSHTTRWSDILSEPERSEGESKDRLPLDPDLEEASERPLHILLVDHYFSLRRRRRRLVRGASLTGLGRPEGPAGEFARRA